ncbi:MAG: hypothetical protein Q9218_006481 [Villophora microphyllina]
MNASHFRHHFYSAFHRYLVSTIYRHGATRTGGSKCLRRQHRRIQSHYESRSASTVSTPAYREIIRPQNHYDLFPSSLSSGPPPNGSFHINPSILRREFLQLQARAHPDRHQGADKVKAEAASARINDAYRTLLNPLARARYLLSLQGVEMGEDESIAGSPSSPAGGDMDAGLLMEVMEVREGIEAAQSRTEIEEMKAANEERKSASEERLDQLFQAGDIEGARRETVRLGYWVNVGTALNNWEMVGDGRVSEHD